MSVIRTINLDLDFRRSVNDLLRQVIDKDTGKQLRMFRADSTRFSMVFKDGEGDFDMSGVSKISLEVKPRACTNPPTPTMPLWIYGETETIPDDGDPAIIEFAAEETALPDGGAWMTVTLYGAAGEVLTTVSGSVTILGNGRGTYADVPDVEDARDEAIAAANRAEGARDAAEGYRDQAQVATGDATTARNQAVAAKTDAETARDDAISARNAAQNARNAAQSAQTGAETARDQANTARNQAQTAQGAAEGARDAAQGYRNEALNFRNQAQSAVGDASDEADRAESAANTAATQANRAQTQADRAKDIADNLEAVGTALSYRGEWTASTAPTGAQRGWFWVISAAATWSGIAWQVGDAALYNGSAWQRVALDWLLAQANANINALRREVNSSKVARGGVQFSGVSGESGAEISTITGASYPLVGQRRTVVVVIDGYDPLNSSLQVITSLGGGTSAATGSGWSIYKQGRTITFSTKQDGAMGGNNYKDWSWTNALPSTAKPILLAFDIDFGATGSEVVSLSINGEAFVAGTLIDTGGVYGDAEDNILRIGRRSTLAGNRYAGVVRCLSLFNRGITATELTAIASSGGQIVPIAARGDNVLHLPMDDGTGYQLQDHSGNARHALLSETGCTHLVPRREFEFAWTRVSSGFLGDADRPVLPEGAVIESIIWEDTKATRTAASLGYNASNAATHVASFTPTQDRQFAALAAGSMAVSDRRLYLHMSANAGAVTVRVRGRSL